MKKMIALVLCLVLALSMVGCSKNNDSLPSLSQVAEMEDEAELNSYITKYTKAELSDAWGEPNESSKMEDVWYIDENTKLVVNYHNNDDKAVVCSIVRVEQ